MTLWSGPSEVAIITSKGSAMNSFTRTSPTPSMVALNCSPGRSGIEAP